MPGNIEETIARAVRQVPHRSSPLGWALLEVRDLKRLIHLASAVLSHVHEVEGANCSCSVCWAAGEVGLDIRTGRPAKLASEAAAKACPAFLANPDDPHLCHTKGLHTKDLGCPLGKVNDAAREVRPPVVDQQHDASPCGQILHPHFRPQR